MCFSREILQPLNSDHGVCHPTLKQFSVYYYEVNTQTVSISYNVNRLPVYVGTTKLH